MSQLSPGHGGGPGPEPVPGLGEHTAERGGAGTRGGRGAGGQEATQRGGNAVRFSPGSLSGDELPPEKILARKSFAIRYLAVERKILYHMLYRALQRWKLINTRPTSVVFCQIVFCRNFSRYRYPLCWKRAMCGICCVSSYITAYNRWKRADESLLHDFATEKLIYYDT